jgi:hypothetical protein
LLAAPALPLLTALPGRPLELALPGLSCDGSRPPFGIRSCDKSRGVVMPDFGLSCEESRSRGVVLPVTPEAAAPTVAAALNVGLVALSPLRNLV